MEVKDLPQITQSTESDFAVSSTSQKTRLISFKNIFEKISFSSLATKAKNIIGAINEINTDLEWKTLTHSSYVLNSGQPNDVNGAGLVIVTNSNQVKNAKEIYIPSLAGYRGSDLCCKRIRNYPARIVSTYGTQGGYYLSYLVSVDFINGNIAVTCTQNSWGLSTVSLKIDANSILYR